MKQFLKNNAGATAIEYALILSLIVLVCVAAFSLLGNSSSGLWANVNNNVANKL